MRIVIATSFVLLLVMQVVQRHTHEFHLATGKVIKLNLAALEESMRRESAHRLRPEAADEPATDECEIQDAMGI